MDELAADRFQLTAHSRELKVESKDGRRTSAGWKSAPVQNGESSNGIDRMKDPPLQTQTRKDGPPRRKTKSKSLRGVKGRPPARLVRRGDGSSNWVRGGGYRRNISIDVRPIQCYISGQLSRSTDQTETYQ